MAYIQNIASQQKRLMEEMDRMKSSIPKQETTTSRAIEIAAPVVPPIDQAALEAFGQKLTKDIMNEVGMLLRSEIRSSETSTQTRIEQFVSKTLKDRLELAMQPMRSQLNDMDLRIEELREDVSNMSVTTEVALPMAPQPSIATSTASSSRIDIDALPTSSIDIEALTKNILGGGSSVSSNDIHHTTSSGTKTEDINFSQNKKKILRKTLPTK